jgi:hypothetical protein
MKPVPALGFERVSKSQPLDFASNTGLMVGGDQLHLSITSSCVES